MKNIPQEIKLLSVKDVMAVLGIKSQTTIYKLMYEEKILPFRKVGRLRRFTLDDVKQYLEKCKSSNHSRVSSRSSPSTT